MGRVKPDKPVVTLHASDWDRLPPEQREALSALVSESQRREALEADERERRYQSEQAEAVLSRPGWVEIEADWLDSATSERDAHPWELDYLARTYVYDEDGNEYDLSRLPDDRPTIHQFYRDLYGAEVSAMSPVGASILVNHRDRKHPYQVYDSYPEFISGVTRETSFIYLGRFWEPTDKKGVTYPISKKNAMTHINGVCVDIDRVEDDEGHHYGAKWVMDTLFDYLDWHRELMPNYLMLSGTGVQLWYVFGESIPLLSKKAPRRAKYDRFIKLLYRRFDEDLPKNRFKVDKACAAYNHAFRAPGSPSKHGYPARLFVLGGTGREMTDPIALSTRVGGDLKPYDVGEWDPEYYASLTGGGGKAHAATDKQLAYIEKLHKMGCVEDDVFERAGEMDIGGADAVIKHAESLFTRRVHYKVTGGYAVTNSGRKVRLKTRDRGLYDKTLSRIYDETKPGSRYMSMFALAGLAYNCNVPEDALERDLEALMNSEWGRKPSPTDGRPITQQDVRSAMRGYNPIGCLRPREITESLVGWSYGPPEKRNGRTLVEHLHGEWHNEDGRAIPNKCKTMRDAALSMRREQIAESKTEALASLLKDNPSSSKRQASKELHMSLSTVQKYWRDACAAAGIEDARSGNHSPR